MSFFSTALTRTQATFSAGAQKISDYWRDVKSWHNRTLVRVKIWWSDEKSWHNRTIARVSTWWKDEQSWHNRTWKTVATWWTNEKSMHNRAAKSIKDWWKESQLKRGYLWLNNHFNRLMEASLPFSRTINFFKNWIQGFVFLWGLMMVYVLAADPMIILAGGALAISNVAFAAAILIAFAYAYYHYRAEKNQESIAAKQTLNDLEIDQLKTRVATLELGSPRLAENIAPTTASEIEQKLAALEEKYQALEKKQAEQTTFLVSHGYCPVFESDAGERPENTDYSADSTLSGKADPNARPSYLN